MSWVAVIAAQAHKVEHAGLLARQASEWLDEVVHLVISAVTSQRLHGVQLLLVAIAELLFLPRLGIDTVMRWQTHLGSIVQYNLADPRLSAVKSGCAEWAGPVVV